MGGSGRLPAEVCITTQPEAAVRPFAVTTRTHAAARASNSALSGPPVITFLSDYGLGDEFVGVCHGVIAVRCPQARVIDLAHGIPPQDVRTGALVLRETLPYMPAGVHLAVVDPDVGAGGARRRRALALRVAVEGRLFVGPDNGLLMPACDRFGGVVEAVDVSACAERLQPLSATFHGRDVFAPVAAALAAGASLAELGDQIAPGSLGGLCLTRARVEAGALHARVVRSDGYGNVALDASGEDLREAGIEAGTPVLVESRGRRHPARRMRAFADAERGELLVYEDSLRMVALAVNGGSAAQLIGARPDDEVVVRPL